MARNTLGSNPTQPRSERDPGRAGGTGASFWRFSLALYARPGVADALITLQDRAGIDVNLVLFGLWIGARYGVELGGDGFAAASEAIAGPNGVVRTVRALRRQLAGSGDEIRRLRRAALRLELAAEREVQQRLACWFATGSLPRAPGDPSEAAHANLARCLGAEGGSPETAVLRRAFAALTRRP